MSARRMLCALVVMMACYHGISTAGLGSSCTNTTECTSVVQAICNNGVCTCNDTYVLNSNNTKCINNVPHGGNCEENIQCNYSNGTECRNGACECMTNYHYSGEQCVGSLGLGDLCEEDIQCVVPFDLTQETVWCYGKQCQCQKGFKREDKRCVIGGDCTSDPDCSNLKNSFCDIRQHDRSQCACNNSYIAVANNTKCYPTVYEIGTECEYQEQCSQELENAECKNYQCMCVEGATWNNDTETCNFTGIGSSCTTSEDCKLVKEAICRDSVCTCANNSVLGTNNKCIPTVPHGGKCEETIQCNYSNGTECLNGACECMTNHHYHYSGERCVGSLGLGDMCEHNIQCVVPFDLKQETVWCHGNQCQCKKGFKRDDKRCVIGGDCTMNDDCRDLENSFCDIRMRSRYQCACNRSYMAAANNTKCLPNIGGTCTTNEDCKSVENAICTDRTCICISNFVPSSNTKCIPTASHGGTCEETIQCNYSKETECLDSKCECRANFHYSGAVCVGSLGLGDPCTHDIECDVPSDPKQETVYCYNKQCQCKMGFKREDKRCVIGGDCTTDAGCKDLENSFCDLRARDREGYCACSSSFIPVVNNTKCLKTAHDIGAGCEVNEQCSDLGKAECIGNQCSCVQGVTWNKDEATCAAVRSLISLSCLVLIWLVKLI